MVSTMLNIYILLKKTIDKLLGCTHYCLILVQEVMAGCRTVCHACSRLQVVQAHSFQCTNISNFSPAWFAVNTGTGVISSLFHDFPYRGNSKIMNVFALAFFLLNILLFSAFFALSVACYIMFPHTWRSILHHPVQSFYLSYFPMGAATLITVGTTVVSQYWGFGGTTFVYILWAFWWLDAILSCLCCFGLIYVTCVIFR